MNLSMKKTFTISMISAFERPPSFALVAVIVVKKDLYKISKYQNVKYESIKVSKNQVLSTWSGRTSRAPPR